MMESLKFRQCSLFCFFGLFCVITSCNLFDTSVLKVQKGYSLGTDYTIKYEVANDSIDYRDEIELIFVKMNESLSTYLPTSLISKVNRGDSTIVTDAYFKEVFSKAYDVWAITDGDFDPTVGSLVNAWGFGPGEQIDDLTKEKVDSILTLVGFDKVQITAEGTVKKENPNIFIDFNALAKGYTIDVVGRLLEEKNVENYLIEIGGEILTKGRNTEMDRDWVVAIDDPRQEEEKRITIALVNLKDKAMATSGNYRKYRVEESTGELYAHTINSKTGYTEKSNILSVSVVAPNCMEADAFATAFMVMEVDKVKQLSESLPQLETYMLMSGDDGSIEKYITSGFKELMIEDDK
ncbi:FAD:protein FMN transferase [Ascidiimonas sp. W6]|uniref:FAD:protein FMN transferase n=1 Tax=Ascidiimonas meishanensis TaxID=3128903 RepID=UPI0030ECEB61